MDEIYGTIWVCECCMVVHANGECGCGGNNEDAHKRARDERGRYVGGSETVRGDGIPLSQITRGYSVTPGIGWDDHDDDCLTHVVHSLRERFPDMDWPDVPGGYECECETLTFSRSSCDGCGSYLHGTRHGMTLWKDVPRRRKVTAR